MKKILVLAATIIASFGFVHLASADVYTGFNVQNDFNPKIIIIIVLLGLWTIPWKGVALWKASQNKSKIWFVVLLLVNTLGVLEIIYISFLSKNRDLISQEKK